MAQQTTSLLCPFQMDVDPMERLLLINFEKDADSLYLGFEPQVFDDPVNGRGHLVIGWRVDGRVDVYYESSLNPFPGKYNIAGKGLADMLLVEFDTAYYEVNTSGVQAHYAFTDRLGRKVNLQIEERHPRSPKPFSLLAPMGDAAENPAAMPLVVLFEFYFVRVKHSVVDIRIGERQHRPDAMPMPLDGHKVYFIRYSNRPLIATFNPSTRGLLHPISFPSGDVVVHSDKQQMYLSQTADGRLGIDQIEWLHAKEPLSLHFNPPFPNVQSLNPGERQRGHFSIQFRKDAGCVSGHYQVERTGDQVLLALNPDGGWRPKPDRFMVRLIYFVAKLFKNWPKTYRWNAALTLHENQPAEFQSDWRRER